MHVTGKVVVASTSRSNNSRRCNSHDTLVLLRLSVSDRAGYMVYRTQYKMKMWDLARSREVNIPLPQPHHPNLQQTSDHPHQGTTLSKPECAGSERLLRNRPTMLPIKHAMSCSLDKEWLLPPKPQGGGPPCQDPSLPLVEEEGQGLLPPAHPTLSMPPD